MELALYCPVYGYYEKEKDTIGRRGDYYTSASVGPLFGELLAFQFAEWVEERSQEPGVRSREPGARSQELGAGRRVEQTVQIVETGAHEGVLARDILTWMKE